MEKPKNVAESKTFGLKEYLQWRSDNEKQTYNYMINFITIMVGLVILCLIVFWITGQLPDKEVVSETCTVIKTGITSIGV